MRLARVRTALVLLALTLVIPASQVQAGTITATYSLTGASLDVLAPHISPTGGSVTVALSGFRASVSAAFGSLTGATILTVFLSGPSVAGFHAWTGFAPAVGLSGGFFTGLNAAGTGLTAGGLFTFAASVAGTMFTLFDGGVPGVVPGSLFAGFFGTGGGFGSAFGCFNGFGPPGACTLLSPYSPPPSVFAPTIAGPGFHVVGAEVFRAVSFAPIPEPSSALLLGLGLTGLAAAGRRALRR